jgi:hypothetical protein
MPSPVTAPRALPPNAFSFTAITSVHPDLLDSRFAYVSISRASLDAKIYTNDATELGQKLSGEVSKSFAIEFSNSTGNAMADLSLGQGI